MQNYSPPPPHVTHPGIVARDITKEFTSAVNKLAPGELIKDDHFTLFEAVSALEIMDPKMDSGFLAEGETLDEEYDVGRDLLPEEILGIIDQLLCLEMAWHLGYPLSQTLLTSVYIEALLNPTPTNITEANFVRDPKLWDKQPKLLFVLRAYCVGLIKTCHYVNEIVKEELCYEVSISHPTSRPYPLRSQADRAQEEDFVMNTYDRSLLAEIQEEPIFDLLQSARSDLRAIRNDVGEDITTALDLRLELRIAFLRAIDLMALRNANPDSLKTPWIEMQGLIGIISEQHSLGKPVPEAFSTKLQRHLASTMPPRPIVQTSFEESCRHFEQMFRDGIDITEVLKYSDPQSLLTFVATFQARKPQPIVFIRILLQSLVLKDMVIVGSYTPRQIIDNDLSLTVLPCGRQLDPSFDSIEVPTDPRHQVSAQMELFRHRVTEAYFDLFRIFCQNRCRVRRTLCHSIHEWDMLQADVEEVDQLLQVALEDDDAPLLQGERGAGDNIGYRLPLSSWAYLYKLRQMEWIVQLGFELALYQPDELASMYWYLNYLAKTRAQHGDRIKAFTTRSLNQARQVQAQAAAGPGVGPGGASSGGYTAAKDREYMRSLAYIRATMLDAACTWEFADGLCCLYTGLQRVGLLDHLLRPSPSSSSSHPPPYSDDEHRYRIRTRPFAAIGLPQLPTFAESSRATAQPGTALPDLLAYAEGAVAGARKGYEALTRMSDQQAFCVRAHGRWLADVRACLRAAIAANVAVAALRRAVAEAAGGEGEEAGKDEDGVKDNQDHLGEEKKDQKRGSGSGSGSGLNLRDKFRVEIPGPGQGYHDWWIVPKLIPLTTAT
ncbi:N-alpha-acetyltransferase, non-catalitic subunit [Diatrype stigma]|uniref:N-alpha-acetyltransferase, non-catalitic subunit n=1 Tax=Diatrype stigma TaxID=117547 RepID=A0AAN9UVM8_9PEZI